MMETQEVLTSRSSSKSTETTPAKSQSIDDSDGARARYEILLGKVRKRAWAQAALIHVGLLFYAVTSLIYLAQSFLKVIRDDETISLLSQKNLLAAGIFALLAGITWTRDRHSLGRALIEKTHPKLKAYYQKNDQPLLKTFSGVFAIFLFLETIALGFFLVDFNIYNLFSLDGILGAKRIFTALFTPNFAILGMVIEAMIETVFIALMSTLIAIPFAFLLSFFCSRNLMGKTALTRSIYTGTRLVFNFTRSIEPVIWAIIFSVWVGIGPFAGMLALMIHSIASLAKLYSEQIESINPGPVEAMESTGASTIQVVWFGVVPQVVLPFVSYTIYRWDINVRMATIIGLVGGGGVGTLLMQFQGLAKWNEAGTIVIVIALVVWIMDYLSARIREALY